MKIAPKSSFKMIMSEAEFSALQSAKQNIGKIYEAMYDDVMIAGETYTKKDMDIILDFLENLSDEVELEEIKR